MKRPFIYVLPMLLAVSFAANIYFYLQAEKWKEAWLSQFVATSNVEQLLKTSNPKLSYERVKKLLQGTLPVEASDEAQAAGADKAALKFSGTILLFKNGIYHGSTADLPEH